MLALQRSAVKVEISESYGAVIRSDHNGTYGQLLTTIVLEDAITLAKAILAFAEDNEYDEAMCRLYEEKQDARHDLVSAGFGMD